jgi:hypothetical protein
VTIRTQVEGFAIQWLLADHIKNLASPIKDISLQTRYTPPREADPFRRPTAVIACSLQEAGRRGMGEPGSPNVPGDDRCSVYRCGGRGQPRDLNFLSSPRYLPDNLMAIWNFKTPLIV